LAASKLAERPASGLDVLYCNSNDEDFVAFLDIHPFIVPLLSEIAKNALVAFPGSTLSIRVSRDPTGVDREQLALHIHTNLSPNAALNRLNEFDDRWWLANIDRAAGLISIDVAPA